MRVEWRSRNLEEEPGSTEPARKYINIRGCVPGWRRERERERECGSGGAERRSYQRSRTHVARARGVHGESSELRLLQWLARLRANRTIGRFLLLLSCSNVSRNIGSLFLLDQ